MTGQKDDLLPDRVWVGKTGSISLYVQIDEPSGAPIGAYYTRSDLSLAREAAAYRRAAEVCDRIMKAADEIVNAGADFRDYHSGKAWAAEEGHNAILALIDPAGQSDLDTLLRKARNKALAEAAMRLRGISMQADQAGDDISATLFADAADVVRAMKEEG